MGKKAVILPKGTSREAGLLRGIDIYEVSNLEQACSFLEGRIQLKKCQTDLTQQDTDEFLAEIDFSELKGQFGVRRAVEIGVAGNHNILMIGPPGS